jgi:hypothetical protein
MNFSGSSTSQDGFITFELYFVFFQTNFNSTFIQIRGK